MESVTRLAVRLDIAMLQARGVALAAENTDIAALPLCDPATELGNRLLIKYLGPGEADKYSILKGVSNFSGRHYLTPTPIARSDLVSCLALPPRDKKPCWALLLDPARLTSVRGPRRIEGGYGVEYILEDGFSSDAIAGPGWVIEHK